MIAWLIDTDALLKMAYSSLIAGVAVAVIFSVAILGATRSGDMRRAGRGGAAAAYVALAILGVLGSVAIIVVGLILVAQKS
jgi:hypothetical protein